MPQERDWLSVATNRDPERERQVADEALALKLLAGFDEDERGHAIARYPKKNSIQERQACAALARCVRDYMRGLSGELLALAIDPYTPSKNPETKPTRRVRFESLARGKGSTWARDQVVIYHMRKNHHGKLEEAIQAAMTYTGLKRSAVQAIWRRHQETIGKKQKPADKP